MRSKRKAGDAKPSASVRTQPTEEHGVATPAKPAETPPAKPAEPSPKTPLADYDFEKCHASVQWRGGLLVCPRRELTQACVKDDDGSSALAHFKTSAADAITLKVGTIWWGVLNQIAEMPRRLVWKKLPLKKVPSTGNRVLHTLIVSWASCL